MSIKPCSPEEFENAIDRYVSGESAQTISTSIRGLNERRLSAVLKDRGLFRSQKERYGLSSEKGSAQARAKLGIDEAELVQRYEAGESEKALAESFSVSRSAIRTRLLHAGVTPRNSSQSMYLRQSQMTPEQRNQLAKAAHDAARGRIRGIEEKIKSAKTRQERITHTSPTEAEMAELLRERGIDVIPQQAVGPYNLDIGAHPVAVEIFGGGWHAYGNHAELAPKRLNTLFDAGWNVIVVQAGSQLALTDEAADEVVRFIEQSRRDPSFRRQYRVIRGNGKVSTAFRVDLDKVA